MLIGCNGKMEQEGGRLRIAGAQGAVEKSFALVHVDRIVGLSADVAGAAEALGQP